MFHDRLDTSARRNRVLLAFVSAFALGLLGCGERTVSPPKHESGAPMSSQADDKKIESKNYEGPLFPAMKDGKYGYIDINGAFKIPPTFTSAKQFSEGLAAVYVGGRSFITEYMDGSDPFQFVGVEGGQWGYVDRSGEIKISPQFGYAQEFSEGLALVTTRNGINGEAGYIDKSGLLKISPQFHTTASSKFVNGIAAVRLAKIETVTSKNGGYFDSLGNRISTETVIQITKESSRLRKGHWIDTSGAEIDYFKVLTAKWPRKSEQRYKCKLRA